MRIRCSTCDSFVDCEESAVAVLTECPSCGTIVEPDDDFVGSVAERPKILGHFELHEQIGGGQFGDVWKARDRSLNRIVAVKIPRIGEFDHETLSLFLREARTAATLQHPHIVAVHEVGRDDGLAYIATDFVAGTTLAGRLKERSQPTTEEAALLCSKLAAALHHAHERGVIHRDVKPGNIMIDEEGEPRLMDFGLAKRDGSESTIAIAGEILGTAGYMPPEQARGDAYQADARSDVYSLGIILYELLTGSRPFKGEMSLVLHKVLTREPPAPRSVDPGIPRDLETICLKAIAKNPDGRYQTADAMAADLQRYLRGEPVLAGRPGVLRRMWYRVRRNRMAAGTACLAIIAVVALAMTFALRPNPSGSRKKEKLEEIPLPPSPVRAEAGTVLLDTAPSGADVYIVRLDDQTGEPDPRRFLKAPGKSPVRVRLPMGDYLVVAVKGEQFHEVYRRVPSAGRGRKGIHPHTSWKIAEDGAIRLTTVRLFRNDVAEVDGMCRFNGSLRFRMGLQGSKRQPVHERMIGPYYLDPREVSVHDYESRLGELRNVPQCVAVGGRRRDDPVTCVRWDDAVLFAELVGKRLPTEAEYEFAATNGGRQAFPWGDLPPRNGIWPYGIAGEPKSDVLAHNGRRVFGLYSNVAEWTMSRFVPYPGGARLDEHSAGKRVVRGGPPSVWEGRPKADEVLPGPRQRFGAYWVQYRPKIGFRCVRSVTPRVRPEDFGNARSWK